MKISSASAFNQFNVSTNGRFMANSPRMYIRRAISTVLRPVIVAALLGPTVLGYLLGVGLGGGQELGIIGAANMFVVSILSIPYLSTSVEGKSISIG
jgi:hypothetical protein